MALTDLKSDLSKFRRPIERPIIDTQSVEINRKSNLTPLSDLSDKLTPQTPLKETPAKSVVTPKPFDNTEKFKGQTTPNYEKIEKFRGETTPIPADNTEKFRGETTPKPFDNTEKFKGQTTPNYEKIEKFKGETTPKPFDNTEKFRGETTPIPADNTEKFKGQTTPIPADNTEKFKGETTPLIVADTPEKVGFKVEPIKQKNKLEESQPLPKISKVLPQNDNVLKNFNLNGLSEAGRYANENIKENILESNFSNQSPIVGTGRNNQTQNLESNFLNQSPIVGTSRNNQTQTLESNFLNQSPIVGTGKSGLNESLESNFLNQSPIVGTSRNNQTQNLESNFSNQSPIVGTGRNNQTQNLESNFSNQSPIVGTGKSGLNESLESKFLGQTDPNKMSLESKFLGQTTPTPVDNTEKFKGQTTPTNFNFSPSFTTTEPNKTNIILDKDSQAVTPTSVDFFQNTDSTGFTMNAKQLKTNFVDAQSVNTFSERIKNSKLKTVNFFSNEDAVGFTKNFNPGSKSQFRGIDILSNQFTSNKITTQLGITNWFGDDDSKGFTKNFVDKTKSQFTGISGETFTSPKVKFDGDFGLSFLPGNKIKLEGSAAKYYGTGNQKWQPGGKRYEDNYVSIGDLLIKENSPSYLTKVYGQFNLQDDSFNPYPLFFRQPFILRGIQRKNNKEPQKWGLGLSADSIMGVDLIRGGVLTSTERALVDVARIGQFILSPKGIVWSIMQAGMQLTNRYNKIWTPANLLIAVGGQHIGLKPKRHGLLPFDKIDLGNYELPLGLGYVTKLEGFRKNSIILGRLGNFDSTVLLESQLGGPESLYGIGISTIRTSTNTFSNKGKTEGDEKANFVQKYNPIFENPVDLKVPLPNGPTKIPITLPRDTDKPFEDTYGKLVPTADDDKLNFGLSAKSYDEGKTPASGYEQMWEGDNYASNKLKVVGGEEILNYNQIREFANDASITKTSFNDFRSKYNQNGTKITKLKSGIHKTYFGDNGQDYYKSNNIEKRVGLSNSDKKIGTKNKNIKENNEFKDEPDLIPLIFQTIDTRVQFRGTVNSINETFTPTWTEVKYSGRAENAYLYDTFTRELNFGFRVYAYSVGELKPMWQRLENLAKMTMPTYVASNGYHGNITKFTLGTMYKNFPALISSLQYAVPDEFTWEIGLNEGSAGNELPMGVDVTIGLKLLGKKLHSTENTPIYDYN